MQTSIADGGGCRPDAAKHLGRGREFKVTRLSTLQMYDAMVADTGSLRSSGSIKPWGKVHLSRQGDSTLRPDHLEQRLYGFSTCIA